MNSQVPTGNWVLTFFRIRSRFSIELVLVTAADSETNVLWSGLLFSLGYITCYIGIYIFALK